MFRNVEDPQKFADYFSQISGSQILDDHYEEVRFSVEFRKCRLE